MANNVMPILYNITPKDFKFVGFNYAVAFEFWKERKFG